MTVLNFAILLLIIVAIVGLWWWVEVGSARMHMKQAIRELGPRGQVPPKRPPPQRRREDPAQAMVFRQPDPERRTRQCRRKGDPKWWQQ